MTEFHDFLRRKLAYVAIAEFKPGAFPEARAIYEEAVATYMKGFQGAYLLQEPGTDRGIATIFWESVEDWEEHQTQAYQNILDRMNPLFAKPPIVKLCDVVGEIAPKAERE